MTYPQPPEGREPPSPWQPPAGAQPPSYGQQPSHPPPPQPQWSPAHPHGAPPPPYYGGPPYPPVSGTNGFAIAALVLSLFGGILLSVIFGIVALRQTKRTGQKGRGLAIAGLVISALWALGLAIAVLVAIGSSADRAESGEIVGGGDVSAFDLTVGDCINQLEETHSVTDLPAVPCAEPHEGEVFAIVELPRGAFPGEAQINQDAERECYDRFEGYAPAAVEDPDLELFFLHPTSQSWARGDHRITCVARDPKNKRTGSIRG